MSQLHTGALIVTLIVMCNSAFAEDHNHPSKDVLIRGRELK